MTNNAPTIFAPATGLARAAVSVIRVSGPGAFDSVSALCGKVPPPRMATLAILRDPANEQILDHGLVIAFKGPASFTGEDVVEYHLHGGPAVLQSCLSALRAQPGHRMAEPGEFTRRAFENGKCDLTSAEAINDLIQAETEAQQIQALDQLGGGLSYLYESWREKLVEAAAYLEATIDFADEDLPEADILARVQPAIASCAQEIAAHLSDNRRGERVRDGIKIAVIGAPNAGKSSLVNALAKRDICITSDIEGTTRDVIDVHLNLGGFPVTVSDTAGLRPGQLGQADQDKIESEGIRRAIQTAEQADLRLLVFDGAKLPELHKDTLALATEDDLVIVNKSDLASEVPERIGGQAPIVIAAARDVGLHALTKTLTSRLKRLIGSREGPSPTRARHRQALEKALAALQEALEGAGNQKAPELVAEDLRAASRAIGSITGKIDVENLLDVIFRDFCIGK